MPVTTDKCLLQDHETHQRWNVQDRCRESRSARHAKRADTFALDSCLSNHLSSQASLQILHPEAVALRVVLKDGRSKLISNTATSSTLAHLVHCLKSTYLVKEESSSHIHTHMYAKFHQPFPCLPTFRLQSSQRDAGRRTAWVFQV